MSGKYSVDQAKQMLQNEKTFNLNNNKLPDLRIIRVTYPGLKTSPNDIPNETPEGVVFFTLQTCYLREKNISEGKIVDVLDGFRHGGIPTQVTWDGLKKLKELGYMRFTDPKGIVLMGGVADHLWYQWTQKYFDLLMDAEDAGKSETEVVRHEYDVAKWDNVK